MYIKLPDRLVLKGPHFEGRILRLKRLLALRELHQDFKSARGKVQCDDCQERLRDAHVRFMKAGRSKNYAYESAAMFSAATDMIEVLYRLAHNGITHNDPQRPGTVASLRRIR